MKTALIILSALTAVILSRRMDMDLDVSFIHKAKGKVAGVSTRFFWCQIYQGNCVSGCSGNTKHTPVLY